MTPLLNGETRPGLMIRTGPTDVSARSLRKQDACLDARVLERNIPAASPAASICAAVRSRHEFVTKNDGPTSGFGSDPSPDDERRGERVAACRHVPREVLVDVE